MKIAGSKQSGYVWVNGNELWPIHSQRVNRLADKFWWGDLSRESQQLALALLLMVTSKKEALSLYEALTHEGVSRLPDDFEIEVDLMNWIVQKRQGVTP